MKTLATALVGVLGAAVTGGATAAAGYVQANGATQDWKPVAAAATTGALVAGLAYITKSPRQS